MLIFVDQLEILVLHIFMCVYTLVCPCACLSMDLETRGQSVVFRSSLSTLYFQVWVSLWDLRITHKANLPGVVHFCRAELTSVGFCKSEFRSSGLCEKKMQCEMI